ncbi:MAG: sugar phosphate isomerase/epimerase [Armatimonadetes bacterium]|nr:sugar phosphate isomerase/epimerase [Armatimonadota bacterium]
MHDWPIGLSTGCFYKVGILDCLETIRESGFVLLEICSSPTHLDYHDRNLVEHTASRIRQLHLEPYSFHAPFAEHIDITALDDEVRHRSYHEICLAAEAAARLGVRYFVLHPGPEKSGLPRGERLDRMENAAKILNLVSSRCRSLGMTLVLENMLPHLFSGHVRDLLWLMGSLETIEVGICLDTGHALLSGDLRQVVHKLSGHLWMVHASDNLGRFDDHLPPGEGIIEWPSLLGQLGRTGFRGALILELCGDNDPEGILERAQTARIYLRSLEARIR